MKTENITTNEQEQVSEAPKIEAPKKVRLPRVGGFINSPWLLILVPLLGGVIWLAGNTWVITDNLNKPYMLLAGPATVASILFLWVVINFFKAISTWCKSALQAFSSWKKKEGSTFWLVIAVFLVVSVLESGTFFNELLGPNSLHQVLGYASALVIDLVSVECMRARQKAVRKHDESGERLYQVGVIVCAMLSAFGNVYTALEHFKDPVNTQIPEWMIHIAPVVGVIFPLLMVFLSFAGDYTADQASSSLDPEQYQQSENSRIRFFEIQRDTLAKRVEIEQQINRLSAKLRNGKERRVFFLINWLFPLRQKDSSDQIEELRVSFDEQMAKMGEYFVTSMQQMYSALNTSIDSQKDTDLSLIVDRITASQKTTIEMVQYQINQANDQTISLIQTRLNESHESIISEVLSRVQTGSIDDDQHPFSYEDEMQMGDNSSDVSSASENAPESADREVQKAKKSTKSAGYQIENDPVAKEVVQNYPNVERWLSIGAKSASLKEIEEVTEHSHRMVTKRFADGTLKRTSRNQNAITMESIIKWLSTAPLPKSKSADREESNQTIDVPQTPSIDVQPSDVLDDTQTNENLTNTDELEVISIDENVEFDPDSNDGLVDDQESLELAELIA